jgi:hypothetical protein
VVVITTTNYHVHVPVHSLTSRSSIISRIRRFRKSTVSLRESSARCAGILNSLAYLRAINRHMIVPTRHLYGARPMNRLTANTVKCTLIRLWSLAISAMAQNPLTKPALSPSHKIFAHDDFHNPWNTSHRLFVYVGNRCSHFRRVHHSPVQHPRDPKIVNELEPTSHQGGSVQRGNWFTQHVQSGGDRRFAVALSGRLKCLFPISSLYRT